MQQPLNEHTSHRALAWLIWSVSLAFVLLQFSFQLSSGVIVKGLMHSFHLSALGGGFLSSTYYYVYVTLQIPAGLVLDRYGPRWVLTVTALVMTIGGFLFSLTSAVWLAILGRLLMGAGGAFAFVGSLSLMTRWFPVSRFALLVALAEAVGMIGSLAGNFTYADFVARYGWRDVTAAASAIGIVLTIVLGIVVRDNPPYQSKLPKHLQRDVIHDLKILLSQLGTWMNGLYCGLVFSIVTVFVALWAIPFLELQHHLSLLGATFVSSLVFVGVAVGGPILGWVDSKLPHRRFILVGFALIAAVLLSLIIYVDDLPVWLVGLCTFFLGITTSTYVLNFAVGNEIATPQTRSTSMGFVNAFAVGTAPILQPFIGWLLYLWAHHSDAVHLGYSIDDYHWALLTMPVLLLLAAVVAFFIPRKPAVLS